MNSITVKNYRCFGAEQTARLAPLTLFVGENSSGKTSLAAMIRALWDVAYGERLPDFKEPPYDLGSFDEIVHHSGESSDDESWFEAAFETIAPRSSRAARKSKGPEAAPYKLETTFGPQWGVPVPSRRRISRDTSWVEQSVEDDGHVKVSFGTDRGTWTPRDSDRERVILRNGGIGALPPFFQTLHLVWRERAEAENIEDEDGASTMTEEDERAIVDLIGHYDRFAWSASSSRAEARPLAGAPIRSHPKRTYDPASVAPTAEGEHVPMYMAQLSRRDPEAWENLKGRLDEFGRDAGLFDEVDVRHLGDAVSDPFQIQVRTSRVQGTGSRFNVADVGYGVSQVLPLVAELLREDGPGTMLLQQPEVHLHPSAEAALGSLLCSVIASEKVRGRQLIVETHSDFIIDRVSMAVRDGNVDLRSDDVSIVYFERSGLDVALHSIRLDELGNLRNPPEKYRQFFIDESLKFLGA